MERKRKTSRFHPRLAGRKCFRRVCNPHCLRLYLMVLGLLALWEGRSEVVLGCLGALLTLSGYGDTERDMTGSGNKNSNSPSLPAGDC